MWKPKIGTNVQKLYEDTNKVQRDSFFTEMYEDKSMEGTDEIIDEAEDEDESKPISVGSKEGRTIVDAAAKVLGGLGKNKKVGAAAVKTAVQNNGDEDIEEIEDPEDLEEAGIMVAGKAISQEQKNDVLRLFAAMGMEPVDGMIEIIRIAASMIDEIKLWKFTEEIDPKTNKLVKVVTIMSADEGTFDTSKLNGKIKGNLTIRKIYLDN